jgi:hypothetical protein
MKILSIFLVAVILMGCGGGAVNDKFATRVADKSLLEQLNKLPIYYPVWENGNISPVLERIFEVSTEDMMPEVQGAIRFEGENKGILTWYLDTFKTMEGWELISWNNYAPSVVGDNGILPGDDPDSTWSDDATASILAKNESKKINLQLLLRKTKEPLSVEADYTALRIK